MAAPNNKGDQPQPNSNWLGFVYFIFFIVIGSFCLMNLYTGVIFDQFSKIRLMSQTGSAFLTDKQQVGPGACRTLPSVCCTFWSCVDIVCPTDKQQMVSARAA